MGFYSDWSFIWGVGWLGVVFRAFLGTGQRRNLLMIRVSVTVKTFPSNLFQFQSDRSRQQAQKAWQAAGLFLQGNKAIRQGNNQQAIQAYLRAYQVDPQFSPARGQLFQYALISADNYSLVNRVLIPLDQERLKMIWAQGR